MKRAISLLLLLAIATYSSAQIIRNFPPKQSTVQPPPPEVPVTVQPQPPEVPITVQPPPPEVPPMMQHPTFLAPPSLSIVAIDPATPLPDAALRVNFRLLNDDLLKITRKGWIQASILDGNKNKIQSTKFLFQDLATGQNLEGIVKFNRLPPIPVGEITLTYYTDSCCIINPQTGLEDYAITKIVTTANANFQMAVDYDKDEDGIPDYVENRLLEKFRPYYKFSMSGPLNIPANSTDEYRPTDALWYIQQSELLKSSNENDDPTISNSTLAGEPRKIILADGSTDITVHKKSTGYYINPIGDVGRNGADWNEVMGRGNVGLYGHVVPIFLKPNEQYDFHKIPNAADPAATDSFYKIEYWQFFGFNEGHNGPEGQHEGDWITVQLLYNPRGSVNEDSIESVYYYEHGDLEIKFVMPSSAYSFPNPMPPATQQFIHFRGRNYGNTCRYPDLVDNCMNNTIIFAQDMVSKRFTHPVVYIENGGHEPWPTKDGWYIGVANHNGDDMAHAFLTSPPPTWAKWSIRLMPLAHLKFYGSTAIGEPGKKEPNLRLYTGNGPGHATAPCGG